MLLLDDRLKQLRRDGVPSRNFERRAPKNLETTPLQDDQACGSPLLTKREGAALGRRPAARPSAEPGRKLIRRGGKRRREELSGLESSQRGDRVGCHPMPRFDSGSWRMQKFFGSAAIPRGQEPALACNQRAGMAGAIGSGFENELATCYCRMMPGTGSTRIDEHCEEHVGSQ